MPAPAPAAPARPRWVELGVGVVRVLIAKPSADEAPAGDGDAPAAPITRARVVMRREITLKVLLNIALRAPVAAKRQGKTEVGLTCFDGANGEPASYLLRCAKATEDAEALCAAVNENIASAAEDAPANDAASA